MRRWIALLLSCLLLAGCSCQTAPEEAAVVETQWPSSDAKVHTRREMPLPDSAQAQAQQHPLIQFRHVMLDEVALYELYPTGARNAPLVIFFHEQGVRKDQFMEIAVTYAQAGYFCVLMDLPGYGERRTEQTIQAVESVVMATADVDLLLEYYRLSPLTDSRRFALFGVSMGGSVAYHYAAFGKKTPSLLLVCSTTADFDHLRHQGSVTDGKEGPVTWDEAAYHAYSQEHAPMSRMDRLGAVPVFAVHGELDTVVPPTLAHSLADALAPYGNARFLFVEQAGHEATKYLLPHMGALLNQYLK